MENNFEETFNFLIGSLISADNNTTNEERKSNIETLQKIIEHKDSNFVTDYQIEICQKGIELLEKEIKESING